MFEYYMKYLKYRKYVKIIIKFFFFCIMYNCHNVPLQFYNIKEIVIKYSFVIVFFDIMHLKWYLKIFLLTKNILIQF